MDLDISKWFDVLKASAWQYFFLAIACGEALWFDAVSLLPVALDSTIKQIIELLGLAFAGLWPRDLRLQSSQRNPGLSSNVAALYGRMPKSFADIFPTCRQSRVLCWLNFSIRTTRTSRPSTMAVMRPH
jgi:hypothetical protein